MDNKIDTSPVSPTQTGAPISPEPMPTIVTLTFPQALRLMVEERQCVTRDDWGGAFGFIKQDTKHLTINISGVDYDWILTQDDIVYDQYHITP